MAANPSLATPRPSPTPRPRRAPSSETQSLPVPASWRIGQLAVLGLIAAFALWFYFIGPKPISLQGNPPIVPDRPVISDYFGFPILAALTWLATPTAGTIAVTTFLEALRRRWIIGFLGFSVLVLVCSPLFTPAQLGEEQRFLQDISMGFIIGMTVLISIFLGVTLVPPEIERRTIFTILSKPVNRIEFLVGKFLGLCLTLLFCMVVLGGVFLTVFVAFNLHQNGAKAWTTGTASAPYATLGFQAMQLFKALVLNYGQLVVLGALSMLLSLVVSPITAITFCFLAYFGGQMSSYWSALGAGNDPHNHADSARNLSGPMQGLVKVLYLALPRMDHFDVRQNMVTDSLIPFSMAWKAWSSGLVYVGVLLLIGYLIFSEREF
jgi:Cu-processing system permease protein